MIETLTIRARQIRNVLWDLRAGRVMWGQVPSSHAADGAVQVESTDYGAIELAFGDVIGPDDVLVDIGCGRGRVLSWWNKYYPSNKKYGLELEASVAQDVAEHFASAPAVEIRAGDAIENLPTDATLIYLYNPFDAHHMRRLKQRIEELYTAPGPLVVYYNALHADVFTSDERWDIEEVAVNASGLSYSRCVRARLTGS